VNDLPEVLPWAKARLSMVNEAIARLEELAAYYETWGSGARNSAVGYEPVSSTFPDSKCSE